MSQSSPPSDVDRLLCALCMQYVFLTCGRHEFEFAGPVYEVERDYDSRSALVEMKRCVRLLSTSDIHLQASSHRHCAPRMDTQYAWSASCRLCPKHTVVPALPGQPIQGP